MAFPAENMATELLIDGSWVDVTSDVRGSGDIVHTWGRSATANAITPSTLQLRFNDFTTPGKYNVRNPLSPYYGKIGRNTQIRHIIRPGIGTGTLSDISDPFTRTVSNGWGTTPNGSVWSVTGVGGALFSDFAVDGSKATQYVSSATGYRMSYLDTITATDGNMLLAGITAPQATGGDLEVGVMYRMTSTTSTTYGMVRLHLTTTNAVQIKAYSGSGGTQLGSTVTTALTHTGTGQPLSLRVRLAGKTIWVKVWATAGAEPAAWTTSFTDTYMPVSGWIGVRAGRGTGNTNAVNPQFGFDSFSFIREEVRFHGEVASWLTRGDSTRREVTTAIEAAGIMRRLRAGEKPLDSALKRFILTYRKTAALGYWSFEDGSKATEWTSEISGIGPIPIPSGAMGTSLDSDSFVGSEPLPVLGATGFTTPSVSMPNTGTVALGWIMKLPAVSLADNAPIIDWRQSGTTVVRWELIYKTGFSGQLLLRGLNNANTVVVTTGTLFLNPLDGRALRYAVNLVQSGANVNWSIYVTPDSGSGAGVFLTGTFNSVSIGRTDDIRVNGVGQASGTTFGHLVIGNSDVNVSQFLQAPWGYNGETTTARFTRLCTEQGIAYENRGTSEVKMGPQPRATFSDQLKEIDAVEQGIIYEPFNFLGLGMVTRNSLYNQTSPREIPHSSLQEELEPLDDDSRIINRVTVTRSNSGGSAVAEQTSGPMSTADAPAGVGLYDQAFTVNTCVDAQNASLAGFLLMQGTWNEPRHPEISIEVAKAVDTTRVRLATAPEGAFIRVTGPPPWLPPDPIELVARGGREVFANSARSRGWRVVLNAVPYGPWQIPGAWGDGTISDAFRVDVNERNVPARTSVTAGAISSTATSLGITSPDARNLWTTEPQDFPFLATLGGEDVYMLAAGNVLNSNFGFESGTTGWTGQNATIAASTVRAIHGTTSLLVTPNGSSATGGAFSDIVATVPSTMHQASAWVYSPNGISELKVQIDWWTSVGGSFISSSLGAVTAIPAGVWTSLALSATAPGTANAVIVRVQHTGTPAASAAYHADLAIIARSVVVSSMPQIFTVSRSANGVVKAQPIGTEIVPKYPAFVPYF